MNQQRVWREYACRGTDEVGTTAAGILFRRAKLLERTGILEEEAEAERQAETEVRAEATRRLVESRTQIEREPVKEEKEDNNEATDDSNQMTEQMLSKEMLELRFHADERECLGAHWIDPDDLVGASEFYVPESALSGEPSEPEESDPAVEDVVYCAASESKMDSETIAGAMNDDDSRFINVQCEIMNENNQNSVEEMTLNDMDPLLRRVHTSPMIVTRKTTNDSKQLIKRRIKSTVTLPDIVVNTTSDFKIPESYEATAYDEDHTEDDVLPSGGDDSNEKQERLLPHRKDTVHGNMIQPAYFQSKITKIHVPSTSLTPPQIRRVASPVLGKHQQFNTDSPGQSPKTLKKIAPNYRRISSPASSMGRVLDEETAAPSMKEKKSPAMLRRISSSNPPNQGPLTRSGSSSPATSPETSTRGRIDPHSWSPKQDSRKMKEKFMLEAKLYIPKASKNERRHIVPDKQEMLYILEEQKRELQKRIDRFLERQIRRSQTEPGNLTSKDI